MGAKYPTAFVFYIYDFSLLSSFSQVTASVTAGNVNATLVTLVTTVTAPSRHLRAFLTMDGCAAGEAAVRVVAVSAPSRVHSEKPAKNAPHALMPVVLRGKLSVPYRTLYLRGILSFLLSQRKSYEVLFFSLTSWKIVKTTNELIYSMRSKVKPLQLFGLSNGL